MSSDLYPRHWTRRPVRYRALLPARRRWTTPGARLAFWWRSLDARR